MQHGRIVHVAPPLATHSHVLAGGAAIITLGGDAAWEDRARGTAVHAAPPLATHFHAPPPLLPLTCWQAMQRSSLVVAMQHGRIVHVAPPAALMPELMLGDAGVDEGACMGDADKSMHDGSRIDAHTRGLLVKLLGEQQGERDGEEGGKEGESSSLKGSGRGDGKEIAENVEAGEAAGEPGGLSTMEGRGVSGAAACTTGAASEESRQEDGAPRPDNPDMKCRGCSSGGKGEKAGAALEEEERREAGSVRLSVYRRYCAAVGWPLLALVLASLALMQGSRNAADVTLSLWTDAVQYAPDSEAATNAFYLRLFTFIALLNSLLTLLRAFSFARAGMTAAHRVHHELLAAVVRTPLAFFDTNPSGRILNRFSSDLYTVDDSLPFIANILLANSFSLAGIAALLLYTQWTFLLLLLPLTYIYSIIQHLYRQSSRELRRLDSAARSPVYAAFSQLLHGAPTIRAFHAQEHMMRGAMALMSASQHASFSEMAASQWLSVRLQLMAAVVVTFVSVTGIMTTHSLPNVSHPNHLFPNQSPLNHSPPSSTAHQAFPLAPAAPHLPSPLPHLLFPDFNNTSSSFPLLSDPASGHTLPLPINTSLLLPPLQSLSLPALPSISHHFSSLQADGASALWLSPAALLAACPNAWSGTWSGVLSGAASSARARVLLKGLSSVPVIRSIINALQSLLSLALSAPHLLFESATTTTAAVSPGLLGLALAYALPIVSLLNGTLTSLADTEKDMVAVERVLEGVRGRGDWERAVTVCCSQHNTLTCLTGTEKDMVAVERVLEVSEVSERGNGLSVGGRKKRCMKPQVQQGVVSSPPAAGSPPPHAPPLNPCPRCNSAGLCRYLLTSLHPSSPFHPRFISPLTLPFPPAPASQYLDLQHEQDAPPLSPLPGAKGQNGEGAWKDAHAEGEGIVVAGGGERGEWPKEGRVEFRHVSMAYRVGLPLVLSDVSFLIPGGSQALYDVVVARYSSPATAAIGRLLLPYLFPELSAFAIVEDLVSHLRASDARYRAAAPAEFLDRNQPPMFITLYFIVTRLPDSLLSVRDHFLSLDLTVLTVDLLEQHLLTAETSVVAVDVPRSTPRMPFFEGCSPSPLVPSYVSAAAAVEVLGAEDVGAASASAKRRSSKGRGGRGGGGGNGSGGGGSSGGSGGSGGGGSGGSGGGSGGFGGGGGGSAGSGGSGSGGSGGGRTGAQRGELLMSGVAIFDLDYDAILSSMYALSTSAEHDCYRCVPPDPGIEAAALGASEYSLPGTAPAEALHTFTLDSGASRCFFRDSTTLTPLPAPVPVRLANPSAVPSGSLSGLHLPSFSTNLVSTAALQDSMVTTTTPGGQRVSIRTCTRTGRHLAMFTCRPGSSLYTLATEPPEVAASAQDLPDLRLHSDRGGEFSSDLLRDFCHGEGILQSFTLPASPQQNGIAERRIGLVMEVACTSMIHAVAPHFLWPFAVRYAAHQLNLWPRVSLLETSPTLRWTGEAGNASVFRFYHPTSHRVFPSQDITFDKSVPFYHLFPYCSAPPSPPPLFLAPGPPPVDPLPPQGPAPSGVSQVDPPPSTVPVEVAGDSGAARDAAPGGVKPGGAEPGGAEPGGVEPGGAESEGAGSRGAEPGGAEPGGSEPWGVEPRGPTGASPRLSPRPEPLSPQQLREWLVWRARLRSGAAEAGATGDTGAGGASISARAGGTGGTAAAGPGGARSGGTGAAGTGGVGGAGAGDPTEPGAAEFGGAVAGGPGAGGAGAGGPGAGGAEDGGAGSGGTGTGGAVAGGARAVDPGAGGAGAGGAGGTGAGATVQPRPYFVPLLQQVFGVPSSTALTPPLLCPPPDQPQPPLQLASPLPAPPYAEQSGGLTERREPASRPVSPVRTTRRVPRSRPPLVPGTHAMALRPSSAPLRIPLPPPPESSLLAVPDPRSDLVHAASPSVSRLLATVVTDPSFESAAASALVAELLDFAAACRLDYASALVAESAIRCSRLQSATGG
ncbi:unnamed protein product [Closterium sp. NIES-53]